jgi:hypothetical protein
MAGHSVARAELAHSRLRHPSPDATGQSRGKERYVDREAVSFCVAVDHGELAGGFGPWTA